jgi:hypothetical protein
MDRHARTRRAVARRAFLVGALGVAGAALATACAGPLATLGAVAQGEPSAAPAADARTADGAFPRWVETMPRGRAAYDVGFARPELMATLPCFCGCDRYDQAHASLRECFIRPSGEIDPHAAFCETCQDEAIDAARLEDEGVDWPEIHARIVAEYGGRHPTMAPSGGGFGCSSEGEAASCGPSH